jgi:AcrR family transcriptional regulator
LLDAALEEFRRVGFARASISRISEAAGLARSAFYFHFASKADALREIRDLFETSYAARIASGRSLAETLDSLVNGILEARAAVADPHLFSRMLALETDPATGTAPTADSPSAAALERQFARAARGGELRAGLEPSQAARLCLRSIFGCLVGAPRSEAECRADLAVVTSLFRANPAAPAPKPRSRGRGGR